MKIELVVNTHTHHLPQSIGKHLLAASQTPQSTLLEFGWKWILVQLCELCRCYITSSPSCLMGQCLPVDTLSHMKTSHPTAVCLILVWRMIGWWFVLHEAWHGHEDLRWGWWDVPYCSIMYNIVIKRLMFWLCVDVSLLHANEIDTALHVNSKLTIPSRLYITSYEGVKGVHQIFSLFYDRRDLCKGIMHVMHYHTFDVFVSLIFAFFSSSSSFPLFAYGVHSHAKGLSLFFRFFRGPREAPASKINKVAHLKTWNRCKRDRIIVKTLENSQ